MATDRITHDVAAATFQLPAESVQFMLNLDAETDRYGELSDPTISHCGINAFSMTWRMTFPRRNSLSLIVTLSSPTIQPSLRELRDYREHLCGGRSGHYHRGITLSPARVKQVQLYQPQFVATANMNFDGVRC